MQEVCMTSAAATGVPHLGVDPFAMDFFADPFPTHELMRDTGPVVYLDKWSLYGVARYAEVHAVLNDPQTFCSSRGVGLSDFAKEKPWRPASLILEADPPAHTRTRAVLSDVLSPTALKKVRDILPRSPKPRSTNCWRAAVLTPSPISRKPIRCRYSPTRWD
jgi:hypothetical protein